MTAHEIVVEIKIILRKIVKDELERQKVVCPCFLEPKDRLINSVKIEKVEFSELEKDNGIFEDMSKLKPHCEFVLGPLADEYLSQGYRLNGKLNRNGFHS